MAEDVLNQNEMEALVAAVESGAAVAPQPARAERRTPGGVGTYTFERPEQIGKDQIRAVQSLHEGLGRNFATALSGLLRTSIEVKLVSVDPLTYGEFVGSLENPSCLQLVSVAPLEGSMVLELSPSMVYPILDRLLGGGHETPTIPERPLTEIELRLVGRVTALALDALRAVWANVHPIDFKVVQTETNPQRLHVIAPNEVILLLRFEVAIGRLHGMMNLCIPLGVVAPVVSKLSANRRSAGEAGGASDGTVPDLSRSLSGAAVEVVVHLAETQLSTEELMNLQVGDILKTDKPADSGLLVSVEGVPKFRARPGVWKTHKAIRITGPADHTARIN